MNTQSINEQLDAIAQRAEGATAGPWKRPFAERETLNTERLVIEAEYGDEIGGYGIADVRNFNANEENVRNADFIAHSREDVPRLVAALRIAKAALEYIEGNDPEGNRQSADSLANAALARIADCLGGEAW